MEIRAVTFAIPLDSQRSDKNVVEEQVENKHRVLQNTHQRIQSQMDQHSVNEFLLMKKLIRSMRTENNPSVYRSESGYKLKKRIQTYQDAHTGLPLIFSSNP